MFMVLFELLFADYASGLVGVILFGRLLQGKDRLIQLKRYLFVA